MFCFVTASWYILFVFAEMDVLSTCLPKIRIPGLGDNVYKDECCLSFETPESGKGLYVCLTTFLAFSYEYVTLYHEITSNRAFLNIKKIKKKVNQTQTSVESPSEKKPKRLALGVKGGFQPDEDEVEYEEVNKIVILPEFFEIPFENIEEIPSAVLASVSGILAATSALKKEEILAWDGEVRQVTKHGDSLVQLDNGIKIAPSGWKCAKCDLTSNLWMNLSDGTILCGRRYFDGTGGNNHAVDHFKETGYPLAVKLGTITPSGADVHSYDEDSMVDDPCLAKHLSHFGINMMNMEKTEQTMTELEVELNEKLGSEWNIIQEAGKNLKELNGPGLIGLKNMGNACYLNSTMQVLLSIPEFQQRYADVDKCHEVFKKFLSNLSTDPSNLSATPDANNPSPTSAIVSKEIQQRVKEFTSDFQLQMCKLGLALNCPQCPFVLRTHEKDPAGEYATHKDPAVFSDLIAPRSFKHAIGKDHLEFSSNRQQDVHEFFLHLLSIIERSDKKQGNSRLGDCFKFTVEERIECLQSKQVSYTKRCEYTLCLPIPMDQATNKVEVETFNHLKAAHAKGNNVILGDPVRAIIPFQASLDCFSRDENLFDFYSSALKEKSEAKKRTRFVNFPNYLVIQLKKFTVGSDWVPIKLDVSIKMPDTLDLNQYKSTGLQKDEVLLPDINPSAPVLQGAPIEIDEDAVLAISQMGFPLDRCRTAVVATGNTGVEAAVMWLMENHSNDHAQRPGSPTPPEDCIDMIISMGFNREQAIKALKATNNSVERAVDWIFSHMEELNAPDLSAPGDPPPPAVAGEGDIAMDTGPALAVEDCPGNYELFAFISHMGMSTMCGHYVAHVKKDSRWVIFNDEKVAESESPPKDLGYLYFYKRVTE